MARLSVLVLCMNVYNHYAMLCVYDRSTKVRIGEGQNRQRPGTKISMLNASQTEISMLNASQMAISMLTAGRTTISMLNVGRHDMAI